MANLTNIIIYSVISTDTVLSVMPNLKQKTDGKYPSVQS